MASNNDLTPLMAPFVDVHMIGPLLDFLRENKLYDAKIIAQEKIKAISKTNLIDLIKAEYALFPADAAFQAELAAKLPELQSRRVVALQKIDSPTENVKLVASVFASSEVAEGLRTGTSSALSLEVLASQGVSVQALEEYYRYGKFKYEFGMYSDTESILSNFLAVATQQSSSVLGARWGRLSCRILASQWDLAVADLVAIKEIIDARSVTPVDQIRQRAWLLHWSLFVYINQRDGIDTLADLFSERVYLQTIENLCPWLIRYFVAFVLLSPSRRRVMLKDVLSEIQSISYLYSDPMTQFLDVLLNQFDFDGAQAKLEECVTLMKNDFFLQRYASQFAHEARVLMCETYCSLHKRVDLQSLSRMLKQPVEDAEKWLVDVVLSSTAAPGSLEARIDSESGVAEMQSNAKSHHDLIVEKTRDSTGRSAVLTGNLLSLLQEQAVYIKAKMGGVEAQDL